VFFRVTGSLFNPALTLGLTLLANLSWISCIVLTISQFLGGITAAALQNALFPGESNMRTTLSGGTTVNQGFWIEFFSTFMLVFTVYMLAGEKHKATYLAPIGIGLALFLGELAATGYTGGSLNPARSLGPDVIARNFDSFAWIYYAAPYTAVLVATGFFKSLRWLQYYTVVPDQDDDDSHGTRQVIRGK
jgi:aquaporin related protein